VFIIASTNIESKQGRFWDGRERGLLLEEGLDLAQIGSQHMQIISTISFRLRVLSDVAGWESKT
jgi:hypothetical protein